jgi:pimeloyl-ACP methyl ester carboxylesterase
MKSQQVTSAPSSFRLQAVRAAIRMSLSVAERLPGDAAVRLAERLFMTPRHHEQPAREAAVLAGGRRFTRLVDGRRLASWEWGDGPTVLLVHGWEGRAGQMGAFVAPLLARGLRVVAFDAPAHGASPGERTNLLELAGAIEEIAHAEGGLRGIVAHSFGASASTIALGRLGVRAERAVYLAPAAIIEKAFERFFELTGASPSLQTALIERIEQRVGLTAADLNGPALARKLHVPLLAFHDREDRDVPLVEGQTLTDAWPDARLVVTRGLGHRKILWSPEVVAQAAAFLG